MFPGFNFFFKIDIQLRILINSYFTTNMYGRKNITYDFSQSTKKRNEFESIVLMVIADNRNTIKMK